MKSWIYYLVCIIMVTIPVMASANVIAPGQTEEFIGIVSFMVLVLATLLVYYYYWKQKKASMARNKYIIKTEQFTRNGRTFVRTKKIKPAGD